MADYTVADTKLQELNVMIDQGGHIPSAVSEALKDAQIAQAGGNQAALTSAINRAIAANILEGGAWTRVQGWHDGVRDNGTGGTEPIPPVTPVPGATPMNASPGLNGGLQLKTQNDKDVMVNGGNYTCVMQHGKWYYFVADRDGDVASMSSDGGQVALRATDGAPADPAPSIMADPSVGGTPNTAEARPYKKGQFVCMRIGPGGYSTSRAALFSVLKYGG